ncbi:MAG TPA: hypothetical protein VG870_05150 [Chitinophagaceae bacterium]|nr:hypothetical protein [Chitinophagaceae bacterium]
MEKFRFSVKCILLLAMIPLLMFVELSRGEHGREDRNEPPVELTAARKQAVVSYAHALPEPSLLLN